MLLLLGHEPPTSAPDSHTVAGAVPRSADSSSVFWCVLGVVHGAVSCSDIVPNYRYEALIESFPRIHLENPTEPRSKHVPSACGHLFQ